MTVKEAYETYRKRRDREEHPDGHFDSGGRWWPSESEERGCCKSIRSPSRRYPYSLLVHCRTLRHIANLCGVKESELRAYLRKAEPVSANREGGDDYYKLVAKVDGKLLSIYDGETEYQIGVTLTERARQDHNGGYYVYKTPEQAMAAPFPDSSALLDAERVVIKVKAEGSYCRYKAGRWDDRQDKLAFSRITPIEIVE